MIQGSLKAPASSQPCYTGTKPHINHNPRKWVGASAKGTEDSSSSGVGRWLAVTGEAGWTCQCLGWTMRPAGSHRPSLGRSEGRMITLMT